MADFVSTIDTIPVIMGTVSENRIVESEMDSGPILPDGQSQTEGTVINVGGVWSSPEPQELE